MRNVNQASFSVNLKSPVKAKLSVIGTDSLIAREIQEGLGRVAISVGRFRISGDESEQSNHFVLRDSEKPIRRGDKSLQHVLGNEDTQNRVAIQREVESPSNLNLVSLG
jgi:hypothetical protein